MWSVVVHLVAAARLQVGGAARVRRAQQLARRLAVRAHHGRRRRAVQLVLQLRRVEPVVRLHQYTNELLLSNVFHSFYCTKIIRFVVYSKHVSNTTFLNE